MKIRNLQHITETAVSHNSAIKKRVLLENGELGRITQFARSVFPAGAVAQEHVHDDMGEVFLVDAGQGEIVVNGSFHDLEPGTCVVIEAGDRHELRNTGTADLVLTYFGVRLP
jgi:mannose-6-phosphate isomerase-like protein (cupin superfamily)